MWRDAMFVRLLSVRFRCGRNCSSAQWVAPKMGASPSEPLAWPGERKPNAGSALQSAAQTSRHRRGSRCAGGSS